MQTRLLQGSIGPSGLPDLLLTLQGSAGTGRLRLEREGVVRDLYLKSGLLVAADSSAGTDSLEWLLFTAGVLSGERHAEVRALIESGVKRGPALVGSGSLAPASLCEWTERRARFLARDALTWRSGTYEFEEGAEPPAGFIAAGIHPLDLLLEIFREGIGGPALSSRLPSADLVLEPSALQAGALERLMAHEIYVLSLADGRRKVSEICFLSEIGEAETLKTLALLALAGCVRGAAPAAQPAVRGRQEESPLALDPIGPADLPALVDLPAGESPAQMRAVIRIYNDLYTFIYAHMIKEVGPISEQLLEKHLRDVRDLHPALFSRAVANRDGSLPDDVLMRSVNLIRDPSRRDLMVAGLHDYLKAMILAVRRILGTDHEIHVVRRIRELRCTRT